jgi:hypothetical protein
MAVLNHPFYGTPGELAWGYSVEASLGFDAVEVWNIHWLARHDVIPFLDSDNHLSLPWWESEFVARRRIAAVGGSDNHWRATTAVQGVGQPTTWVHAADRSPAAILDGRPGRADVHQLRSRRRWPARRCTSPRPRTPRGPRRDRRRHGAPAHPLAVSVRGPSTGRATACAWSPAAPSSPSASWRRTRPWHLRRAAARRLAARRAASSSVLAMAALTSPIYAAGRPTGAARGRRAVHGAAATYGTPTPPTACCRSQEVDPMSLTRRELLKAGAASGALLLAGPLGALADALGPPGGVRHLAGLAAVPRDPARARRPAQPHAPVRRRRRPDEAFASMRDAGLDVAALTDHSTFSWGTLSAADPCSGARLTATRTRATRATAAASPGSTRRAGSSPGARRRRRRPGRVHRDPRLRVVQPPPRPHERVVLRALDRPAAHRRHRTRGARPALPPGDARPRRAGRGPADRPVLRANPAHGIRGWSVLRVAAGRPVDPGDRRWGRRDRRVQPPGAGDRAVRLLRPDPAVRDRSCRWR